MILNGVGHGPTKFMITYTLITNVNILLEAVKLCYNFLAFMLALIVETKVINYIRILNLVILATERGILLVFEFVSFHHKCQ